MLTRFVRIQLTIFGVASIISGFAMAVCYMHVPTLLGIGRITVTLELPNAGGLYRFSNVTYRGVQVGTVTAVEPTRGGAKATLSLGTSPKIPADLHAEVRSISAVGEQYVDLRPRNDSPPYLHDGAVIPREQASIPQAVGPMLDQISALIKSIPKEKLGALLDESFKGLNGSGHELGSLFDSSSQLIGDANGVADRARMLTEDVAPLLDSQAQTADSIRLWAHSLAGVTGQLSTDDTQVRALLQAGPGAANEGARLFNQVQLTLPVLLANLTTLGQIGVTYHPSFEQLMVLLPPAVADLQAAQPTNNYTGLPLGGSVGSIADPPACTVGFLPPSAWRSPADTTTVDTPDGLYCKLPQDSPLAVRGARNYPCMGHPGKRAPTVEICNSDKPYVPVAARQHFAGPYPLDPNLVSQGVPLDDRVTFGDRIFGPVDGTPRLPPPPQLPRPPSLGPMELQSGRVGPPPSGWLANLSDAPPSRPPDDLTPASPLGPIGLPTSPPPLGPLAPMDSPDPGGPPPVTPAAPGAPAAAPSSFDARGGLGGQPAVAVAKYNPDTGAYVGPDGHVYRQSNLVTSDHRGKTWQDLILAGGSA